MDHNQGEIAKFLFSHFDLLIEPDHCAKFENNPYSRSSDIQASIIMCHNLLSHLFQKRNF